MMKKIRMHYKMVKRQYKSIYIYREREREKLENKYI